MTVRRSVALLPAILLILAAQPSVAVGPAYPPLAGAWLGWPSAIRLGIQVLPMTEELRDYFGAPASRGILVARVEAEGVAAEAGLQVGDVIVSANGQPVRRPHHLQVLVAVVPAGDPVELHVIRDGASRTLPMTMPAGPSALEADPWRRLGESFGERGVQDSELRRRLDDIEKRLRELEDRPDEADPRRRT